MADPPFEGKLGSRPITSSTKREASELMNAADRYRKQLVDGCDIELWQGTRKVARLQPSHRLGDKVKVPP